MIHGLESSRAARRAVARPPRSAVAGWANRLSRTLPCPSRDTHRSSGESSGWIRRASRLGQNAGRFILRRESSLRFLPPGDVVKDDHSALERAVFVAQRSARDENPGAVVAAGIGDVQLGLIDRLATNCTNQRKIVSGIRGRALGQRRSHSGATIRELRRHFSHARGSAPRLG